MNILSTADIEALTGLQAASVRRYVARGTFPQPDGVLGRTPWWYAETVQAWQETRRKPGRQPKETQ